MSSRSGCRRCALSLFLSLLLLVVAPARGRAQDWEAFGAGSDRTRDGLVLRIMQTADLQTCIDLVRGLGRRKDADMQTVIDFLVSSRAPATLVRNELLLRWLLTSVRTAYPARESLRAWIAENSGSMNTLLSEMGSWKSPQLKGALVAFAAVSDDPVAPGAIMEAGDAVVRELRDSDGLIPSEDAALAMDFLAAARQTGNPVFFDPCAAIAQLSRDPVLVAAARSSARILAGR